MCLLYVIPMFLSTPNPPEALYSNTNSNNMLAVVLTPRQLVRQARGSVKCDSASMVVGATRLIDGVSSNALVVDVRFLGEFSITGSAFALG